MSCAPKSGRPSLIVAVSAWDDVRTKARVAAAGMDGHVCKPARLPELEYWLEQGARYAAEQ